MAVGYPRVLALALKFTGIYQLSGWLGTLKHLSQEAGLSLLNLLAPSSKTQSITSREAQWSLFSLKAELTDQSWDLQGVWASKFNERACLSMRKVGLDFADLRMAVLVQRVVPAAYAFVIHTENPSSGAADEIYAEVVAGLGESIVSGMVPGTALSFVAKKTSLENPEVMRLRKSATRRIPMACASCRLPVRMLTCSVDHFWRDMILSCQGNCN